MKLVYLRINWSKLKESLKLETISFGDALSFVKKSLNTLFLIFSFSGVFVFFYTPNTKANLRLSKFQIEPLSLGMLSIGYGQAEKIERNQILLSSSRQFWNSDSLIGLYDEDNNLFMVFEPNSKDESILNLVYSSTSKLPRESDKLLVVNLSEDSKKSFLGNTLFWRHKNLKRNYALKYLPLYSQGSLIGDTAHSLIKKELYLNTLGSLSYGITDWLTGGTNLPAFALGSPNLRLKSNFYNKGAQSWAVATSIAQERDSSQRLLNIDLIWDSVLTENLIAHSMLSVAVISFDEASGVSAIRSYGSSTIQTGYEIMLNDWNRILVGPTYSVETESVGGYFSYIKFYNDFLIQFSITSNNLRELKFSSEEGYLPYLELGWRW